MPIRPSGLISSSPATATWRAAWRSIRGCRFYTDNDSFSHGIWAALDGTFYTDGQTTVDGIKRNNRLENTRLGATLALPVNRYNSVKLYFSTGVSTRAGTNFDAAGIVWQFRFGGGL
jgi:hypothetical protein